MNSINRFMLPFFGALLLTPALHAQTAESLSGILQATRQAEAEQQQATAASLETIATDMRRQKQAISLNLGGVAAAMRAETARSAADNSFYTSGDINYSTYGTDARADIATNASAEYKNPFIMADYSAGDIYAIPAGKKYFNFGTSSSQSALPVTGRLTSGYGYRPSFGRMHRGVDLSLNVGDTVRTAYSGRVVSVANNPSGYGRYVKVEHEGGLETLYAHLSTPLVVHGQTLHAGQPIGLGGATGNATGPHLHFETRLNGVAVDPATYFDFGTKGTSPKKGGKAPISDGPSKKSVANSSSKSSKTTASESKAVKPTPAPKTNLKTETIATPAGTKKGKLPRPASYQVKRGETLAKIARDYGMTVNEICRLNNMSPYTPMYAGKVIRLK